MHNGVDRHLIFPFSCCPLGRKSARHVGPWVFPRLYAKKINGRASHLMTFASNSFFKASFSTMETCTAVSTSRSTRPTIHSWAHTRAAFDSWISACSTASFMMCHRFFYAYRQMQKVARHRKEHTLRTNDLRCAPTGSNKQQLAVRGKQAALAASYRFSRAIR